MKTGTTKRITMQKPPQLRRRITIFSTALILVFPLTSVAPLFGQDDDAELRLRATPRVAFAPADVLYVQPYRQIVNLDRALGLHEPLVVVLTTGVTSQRLP